MPELSLSALASLLQPFVTSVSGHARRLHAEHQAGQMSFVQPTSHIMDELLDETLARIRGGNIDSGWWQNLLNRFGQQYIAPEFLRKPALQEWLSQESVANDLKTIARSRLMTAAQNQAEPRNRLEQSYSERTGEDRRLAAAPIDVVVAILVAGYIIPSDQRASVGIIQSEFSIVHARLDDIQSASPSIDPITRQVHEERAKKVLARILVLRAFNPSMSRRKIRELQARLEPDSGDLARAGDEINHDVQYWTARLCATALETLDVARKFRGRISNNDPDRNLSIVDALIAETESNQDDAVRILRDCDDPDSRASFFALLARSRGASTALDWYFDQEGNTDAQFFTAVGWQNWVFCMAEAGRWQEAAQRLAGFGESRADEPVLARAEGIVNAQLLLPADRRSVAVDPPLFMGITPSQGVEAQAVHAHAATCFEITQSGLRDIEDPELERLVVDWRRWLGLMDPRASNAQRARDEIRQNLETDNPDVNLMPFAWVFGITFDSESLRRYLAGRERLGGLSKEDRRAELLLFRNTMDSGEMSCRDFLVYLEAHREHLAEVMPANLLKFMHTEALVRDDQIERARMFLRETNGSLCEAEIIRLSAMIDAYEGVDPRKELERLYHETGDIIDLENLICCLKQADDREALLPLLEELVKRHRTVENVLDLVICLSGSPYSNYHRVVEFLDLNPDLVEQSSDLKSVKAWALFYVGRLSDARGLNDQLLSSPQAANALVLDINVAVASGDWERLPAIVEREWLKGNEHNAETLLTLAQVASHRGRSADRALSLSRLATEKSPRDPHILTAAYYLHVRLGCDDKVDPSWLRDASELSSSADGPLRSTDFRTLVTEWMPQRRERLAEIQQKWMAGEIPTGIAAPLFNMPLTHLLIQIPKSNADEMDRRMSALLPVAFGGRPSVELQEDWAIGLDISSILVLHYLDLLDTVLDLLHKIKFTYDVMRDLFQEQDRVLFHQPSRVKVGQQVRTLCNQGRLRVADDRVGPAGNIAEEVGSELAVLLQAASQENGKVACAFPIYRPDSLMEIEADISDWNDFIVSVPDLCRLLHQRGHIDNETHERAQLFLSSQGQRAHGDLESSILDRIIYLDRLALSYLVDAGVLEPMVVAAFDLRIHPDSLSDMDGLARESDLGEELAAEIDGIRHVLRNAVESGRASYLPRMVDVGDPTLNPDDQFIATRSLLAAAAEYDALCIDDRFINSKERFVATAHTERAVPIVCVLDLLRYLVKCGHLTAERHWAARHKLRVGGFFVIPFEGDELTHWLTTAIVKDGQLVESSELRTIRQSISRIINLPLINPMEVSSIFEEMLKTCASMIRAFWKNGSMSVSSTKALSDWIWRHLMITTIGDHKHTEKNNHADAIRAMVRQRVGLMLLPPFIDSQDRRADYKDWVERSIFYPLRQANMDLIQGALTSISDIIFEQSSQSEVYGHVFMEQLPRTARQYLTAQFSDRVRRWGFERVRTFDLNAEVSIPDHELFAAARDVFSGAETRFVSGGKATVSLDPEDRNIVLEFPGSEPSIKSKVSELALLSPIPEERLAILRSMLERFGPTAPDFNQLLAELESREPDEHKLSAIFHEAAHGVTAVQGALFRKIHLVQPVGPEDILPHDIDYFKKFVGPTPVTRNPEAYIRDVLIPYRKALLGRDLEGGLDICCLGALRDDLCPGQWISQFDNDAVWDALSGFGADRSPFSLLGALDVALYRQNDARFREFAEKAVAKLCDERFGQQEDVDYYRLFWNVMQFSFNRIHLVENGSVQPAFWKRMSAWMQSQCVTHTLLRAPVRIDMDRLYQSLQSNLVRSGAYAELVNAREEPMLLLSEQLSSGDLWFEIIGRLVNLKLRHENEDRIFPCSEDVDSALNRTQDRGGRLKCSFPGPLEGHRRPVRDVPEDLVRALGEAMPDAADPASCNFVANVSHLYALGEHELTVVREAVRAMVNSVENEVENNLLFLELASIVAKTNRDPSLADAIADAISNISRNVSSEDDVWMILKIILQSAASFEEHDAWCDWLEERLARIALCLPGPPNRSLQIFLTHLDAMEMILPIDSWFHCRARSIASAGADLRP